MSFGIVASKYRRKGSGQPTLIDGLPVTQELGDRWYVNQARSSSGDGTSWDAAYKTIQEGVNKAANNNNDRIFIAPGAYNETVTIANTKNMLTLIGVGGRGAAFIEPTTAGAEGMQVKASDITLINLGVAGDDTADYALNINGNSASKFGRRFRAFGCKFELGSGNNPCVILDGDANYNVSDALFDDCEFAWAKYGVKFLESGYGSPTQIFLQNCRMHNIVTSYLWDGDSSVGPTNLHVLDSVFDAQEDGTEATKHLDLVVGQGVFSGNRFALLTNASAQLVISANIQWLANATEAGWSTARPA